MLQVIWTQLFKNESFCDKGTLKQLANVIRRTNIPVKVKRDFAAARDFLNVVVDAHIVGAAMQFFGMNCMTDAPSKNQYDGFLPDASNEQKSKYLTQCVESMVSQFALHHAQPLSETSCASVDSVLDYACSVVGLGLMARNFSDASKEGDGDRLVRCWKFLMLHFKANGHTKYSVEAFNLLAQIYATLSPQMSHRLVYNRTCNVRGGVGRNIALHLHNEHINRMFKDDLNTFRANISESSVSRCSQAIGPMSEMLHKVDTSLQVKKPSGEHIGPSVTKDFEAIVNVLLCERVFDLQEGRTHQHFVGFSCDPFLSLKKAPQLLQKWLVRRCKMANVEHRIAKRKF